MTYDPRVIKSAYDGIAEKEDDFEKGFSLRNDIPREFIKKYLKAHDIVLDAGGGSGINAIMMAQRCQKVTLLDISPGILERAATNIRDAGLSDRIDLVEGDITDLSQFDDARFSFVVCLGGSLSYVLDKAVQAVRELVRVARTGSILIVGCDSRYGFVKWLLSEHSESQMDIETSLDVAKEVYEASAYEAGEGVRAHLYTVAELTGLLEGAGCQILEITSTPTLLDSWDQSAYPENKRSELMALELEVCTIPELLGMGHHLFCVARKM